VFKVAEEDVWIEGVLAIVDEKSGRAVRLRRIQTPAGREAEEVEHWPKKE
jgi:hypothetical protein